LCHIHLPNIVVIHIYAQYSAANKVPEKNNIKFIEDYFICSPSFSYNYS
jgi:hypothetical protein